MADQSQGLPREIWAIEAKSWASVPNWRGRRPRSRQGRAWQAVCCPPSLRCRPARGPSSKALSSVLEGHDLLGQRQQSWNSNPVPPPSSRHPHPLVPRWPRCGTQASPASLSRGPGIRPAFTAGHSLPLEGPRARTPHLGTRELRLSPAPQKPRFPHLSNGNQNNGPGVLLTIAQICVFQAFFFFFLVSSTEILVP